MEDKEIMEEERYLSNLYGKVAFWWNNISYQEKDYYVKTYEPGWVPVEALTEGAIIRLYLVAKEGYDRFQAMSIWYNLSNQLEHS